MIIRAYIVAIFILCVLALLHSTIIEAMYVVRIGLEVSSPDASYNTNGWRRSCVILIERDIIFDFR